MYNVIATGSAGNAILYHDFILVDCGVTFAAIEPHFKTIQVVLLTHEHKDHINISTLRKMQQNKPSLRIGCCEWMLPILKGSNLRNIDILPIGEVSNYGLFEVVPIQLYHDVPNCGYRIYCNGTKIFHATDTAHLEGITAKDYDLYAIEHNYNAETINDVIKEVEDAGGFAYMRGSVNTHLSDQQARDFIFNNKGLKSQVLRLHESKHKR